MPFAAGLRDILCIKHERVVGRDNCVRYDGRILQIPEQRHRHHFVKVTVQVHEYPDGTMALFHGPRRLAGYTADGSLIAEENPNPIGRLSPLGGKPGGFVDNALRYPQPHRAINNRSETYNVLRKPDIFTC